MVCNDDLQCTKHADFIILILSMHDLQASCVFVAVRAALLLMGPERLSYATTSHSRDRSATEMAHHTSWLGLSLVHTEAMSHNSTCNHCESKAQESLETVPTRLHCQQTLLRCSLYCTRLWVSQELMPPQGVTT